jgi:PHD/YefM family antitoxin component YafN of YafNO toxin-antitoxin module
LTPIIPIYYINISCGGGAGLRSLRVRAAPPPECPGGINSEDFMLVETKQMVPVTKLQKELTRTIRHLSNSGKAVYILKNNNMEAVLLSYREYEYLKNLEETIEQYEIKTMLNTRMEKYNPQNNVSWESVKEEV